MLIIQIDNNLFIKTRIKNMNEQITSFFIRPPRQTYYDHDLGPQMFPLPQKNVVKPKLAYRTDFSILNNQNFKLTASLYQTQSTSSSKCLVYLHTHHGSKLQATCLIEPMLNSGINLCLFDFCGYGNSQGDTVTLGIRQAQDIQVVLQQLKNKYQQTTFVLWGRSMGAVASLIYLSRLKNSQNNGIVGAIFDSPFHSLYQLTLQIGSKNLGLPQPFLRPFIFFIKKSLQQKLNFEQLQLQPIVSTIKTPCVFIASKQDKFVSYTHSQKLYSKYGGPKQLNYIDKDHNQPRKSEDLQQIFVFIYKKMSAFNLNLNIGAVKNDSTKNSKFQPELNPSKDLVYRHFKFIDEYQNKKEANSYFNRHSTQPDFEQRPMTDRPKHPLLLKKRSQKLEITEKMLSARPSPQKSSSSIKYFKNNCKIQKIKRSIK